MHDAHRADASGVLIPYGPAHDHQTVAWLNSPDLQATFGLRRAVTVASHRAWIEANPDTLVWAIIDHSQRHVGNVLLKITGRHRSGYFQIYIGEPVARGQGLGERALVATLEKAFGELSLHRVWLHTLPGNEAAKALYLKHGFVSEGSERDALLADGVFTSQDRWSLLEHEWRARCSQEAPR